MAKSESTEKISDLGKAKSGATLDFDVDQAVVRVRELSEQFIEKSKEGSAAWLQAYEKLLDSMLTMQQDAAAGTKVEWVATLANTNAGFVREISRVYLDAIKSQLPS